MRLVCRRPLYSGRQSRRDFFRFCAQTFLTQKQNKENPPAFTLRRCPLMSADSEKKEKPKRKEWECPAFLPKCKSTPLGVCLHGEAEDRASPLNCHGGRQAGRQAGYFSSKLFSECKRTHTCARTHARRNYLLQTRSLLVPTGVTSNNGGVFLSFFFSFFL